MVDLKLAKLPDRTAAKITITLSAGLNHALREYAEAYQASYGTAESVAELIPFMLSTFIEGDTGFKRVRRNQQSQPRPTPLGSRRSSDESL
jgi:hypothetical protein